MKCDELKKQKYYQKLAFGDEVYLAKQVDAAIAELKQKLEDVNELVKESKELLKESQKMHQRCADNASKQIRRLKRALWLARAERAEAEHAHWATIWFCNTKIDLNINKSSVSQCTYNSNTFRNASEWRNMWYDIARKCRAKAEEYK